MSNIVLKVENLYKRYRLGNVDRTAFKEDVISFMAKLQGKADPYESYITSNELAAAKDASEIKSRYVWSLQDINFEVQQGEILGVIGKNGAGKSTLLKILSKTTAPTKGHVKVKGRIASLLEVGTGFHPDLTGRENIYMNGAIMGMMRHEITRKLDEIIAFAGVEAYIDTPVKRYSSGMYVRLAFAVAAHLEPDILIIDEVLAVGDAEFQKKCIGKMQDVSRGEGRTVLFVSHNMQAVKQLCTQAVYLKNGSVFYYGTIEDGMSHYLSSTTFVENEDNYPIQLQNFTIESFQILQRDIEVAEISSDDNILVSITLSVYESMANFRFGIKVLNQNAELLFISLLGDWNSSLNSINTGKYTLQLEIPHSYFNSGMFLFQLHASITPVKDFNLENITTKSLKIYSSSKYNIGFPNERAFGYFTFNKLWNVKTH